ncbi:Internalin A [Durusdinium trenchii]|uniref:Internalin A n=1 Tax=Durusdinium trenchii TaxID=1381693 RepID=A0ABP0JX29_9DINO
MGMLTSPLTGLSEDLQRLQKEVLEGLEPPDEDDEKEDVRDELQEGLAAIEELVASSWQSSEDFRASRPATGGPAVLSENTVLVVSGEDCVEDVRHLVFRFQRLQSLTAQGSVDLNRLQGLEVLSLSHNQLRDLQPLSALVSLSEVNLNFNQIEDLSPLFDCLQLTKVFAAHNRVSSIAGTGAAGALPPTVVPLKDNDPSPSRY